MTDHVLEHEQQLLGAMLTSAAAIDDAAHVQPGDFESPRHEAIFDAIQAQTGEGQPVDAISIAERLATGDVKVPASYLLELTGGLVTATSAAWHADRVRAASMRRAVRAVGVRLEALSAADGDPLEVVNAARAELDAVTEAADTGEESHESAIYAAIDSLDAPIGLKTPWRRLSDTISGWAPGALYIAGARPGGGKTVVAIGAALDCAYRGKTPVVFSLEMPKNELYLRMLSAVGTVDGETIQHRATTMADTEKLAQAAKTIAERQMVVDDRSAISLAQIRAKVRRTQRDREVGLVIVDYLGLVKPPPDAPRNDRRVQVDAIAQGLKNLARDLRVPVLALAQLNRGIESRADKAPGMADLRESGGIEAAADVVILLHRDVVDAPERLEVTIPKNRHGPQARFDLDFQGAYSRAVDPDPYRTGIPA